MSRSVVQDTLTFRDPQVGASPPKVSVPGEQALAIFPVPASLDSKGHFWPKVNLLRYVEVCTGGN